MAEYKDREHFIPLRKSDLIELLSKDKKLSAAEREPFRQFCILVSAVFHFEYLKELEALKDAYAAFDPDTDTKSLRPVSGAERDKDEERLFEKFTALMGRANFKRLAREEMRQALQEVATVAGVQTQVDLNMFIRLNVFVRGDVMGKIHRRSWKKLWRKEEIHIPLYQRLVLIVRLKPHKRLDRDIDTSRVYLKVFKDIPKVDQDMLLPGARVRFSRLDQALIIYPLAAGIGLTLYNIGASIKESSLAAAGSLLTWGLAGAVGGYGYKSYHSYQVKKQDYSLKLTKSLYYKSLDNNTGVLMRLLDEAEEQECRETFLAYFCLWKYAPPEGWTAEQLDDYVELYLEGNANLKVDFEIGDALAKLERLKIVRKVGDIYHAEPLDKALKMLDWTWDNYFKYNTDSSEGT
ncbi:MAG TPA: DUF3754 domain-containing protein [Gemmataceae bacterium]|nr:DUF3754 domain-containing protein [Gemmataceae bacterium]